MPKKISGPRKMFGPKKILCPRILVFGGRRDKTLRKGAKFGDIYLYESWPHMKPGNLQKVFGRWVVGGSTVSLVFCFGLKTGV